MLRIAAFVAVVCALVGSASIEDDLNVGLAKGMSGDWATQWSYPQVLGAANSHHIREHVRHRLALAKAAGTPPREEEDEEEAVPSKELAILKQIEDGTPNVQDIESWLLEGAKGKMDTFVAAIKESLGSESVVPTIARLSPAFFEGIRATPIEVAETKKDLPTSVEEMVNSATPVKEKSAPVIRKRKYVTTQWLLQQAEKALSPEVNARTISLLKDFLATSEGQEDGAAISHAVRVVLIELLQGRLENSNIVYINGTASMTVAYQNALAGKADADHSVAAIRHTEVSPDHSGFITRDLFTTNEVMEKWSSLSPLSVLNQLEYGFYHDQRLRPPRIFMANPSKSSENVEGYKQGVVGDFLRWATGYIAWMQGSEGSNRLARFDQTEGYRRVMDALRGSSDTVEVSEVDVLAALPQLPDFGYTLCSSSSTKAPTLPHYTRDGYSATEGRPISTVTTARGVIYPLPFPHASTGWKQTLNGASRLVDWCKLSESNVELLTPLSLVIVGGESQLESIDMRFPLLPHERSILKHLSTPAVQRQPAAIDAHIARDSKAHMSHHILWQRVVDGESAMRGKSFLAHAWEQHWRAVALAAGFIAFRMYTGYRYTTKKSKMRQHIYKTTSDLAEEQKK